MKQTRWGIIGPGAIAHNFGDGLKETPSGKHWCIDQIDAPMLLDQLRQADPVSYLTDTLQALFDGHPRSQIDELLPWNFAVASSHAA